MERGKQGAGLNLEGSGGHLRDSAGNAHTVELLQRESFEDQDIEGALHEVRLRRGHACSY
jgi:hypothetical protein